MSKSLCCLAFETINSKLYPNSANPKTLSALNELVGNKTSFPLKAPLFITFTKNDHLRGCIGTFQELPIESGVSEFSINAAFNDSRFPKISKSELPSLEVHVTLLDNFEDISAWDQWTIGEHGLKLIINSNEGYFSGTFLPSVAEEQGWNKETTLWNLLSKADYDSILKSKVAAFYTKGLQDGWLRLVRYEGKKSALTYKEYEEIMQQD